tara:strand:- start:1720 stop:2715 length:996 start_codon:yes stop_codon:yes gene_type:complete
MTLKTEIKNYNQFNYYKSLCQTEDYRKAVFRGLTNINAKEWWNEKHTNIHWSDSTWNTHNGCQKISPGCDNCYADSQTGPNSRTGFGTGDKPLIFGKGRVSAKGTNGTQSWEVIQGRKKMAESNWKKPLTRNNRAAKNQSIALSFSNSMGDWLEDNPYVNELRPRLWDIIRKTPYIHWQLCTKRANRIEECLPPDWNDYENGYPNVWLGVSVESKPWAFRANKYLSNIRAAVRFVSFEPALEPIHDALDYTNIDWVIVGGESGTNRRPFDMNWAKLMQKECEANNVTFFFKQEGAHYSGRNPFLDGEKHYNFPVPRLSAPKQINKENNNEI